MKHYEYISRPYVNPINLEVFGKTLDTLEKGHQEAIAQSSNLKLELAKLPLHESEEPYRQELLNDIENTINNNSLLGNSYYALDDITKLSGDMLSNRRLLSKVKANQDYEEYMDYIDKTELPEDYKRFYREANPYINNEQIDPNTGEVKKYNSWQPNKRPTALPDIVKIEQVALQMAAKDKGSYETIYYKDAYGNYTHNREASVDGLPYYKIGTQYEQLSEEDIKKAMINVINNTPGAIAGLQQDWEVAKWKHNNGETAFIDETTDSAGISLNNFNEYLNKRLGNYYDSVTYNHTYNSFDALAGLSAANLRRGKDEEDKKDGNNKSTKQYFQLANGYTIGESYFPKQSAISSTIASKNAAFSTLHNFAIQRDVKIGDKSISSIPIGELTAEQIYNAILNTSKHITPEEKKEMWITYNAYLDYKKQYDEKVANLSETDKNKIEFITAIENNNDIATYTSVDENGNSYYKNPYFKQYMDEINKLFKNKDEIKVPIKNISTDVELSYILPNYKELGLKIEDDKIIIPKTAISNLYNIANDLKNYLDWEFTKIYDNKMYDFGWLNRPIWDNEDRVVWDRWGIIQLTNYPLHPILKLYNETSESINQLIDNNSQLYTPTIYMINEVSEMMVNAGNYVNAEAIKKAISNNVLESINTAGKSNIQIGIGSQSSKGIVPISYDNVANNRNLVTAVFNQINGLNGGKNIEIGIDSQTLEQQVTIHIPEGTIYKTVEDLQKAMGWKEYPLTIVLRGDFLTTEYKNQMAASPIFKYDQEKGRIINGDVKSVPIIEDLGITLENENGNLILKNGDIKYDYGNGEYATKYLDARDTYRSLQFDLNNNPIIIEDEGINEDNFERVFNTFQQLLSIANSINPNIQLIEKNGQQNYDIETLLPTVRQLYNNLTDKTDNIKFDNILKILNINIEK